MQKPEYPSGAAKAHPEAIAEIEIETQQMKQSWMTNAAGSHHRLVGWPPYWLGSSNPPRENSKMNSKVSLGFFGDRPRAGWK